MAGKDARADALLTAARKLPYLDRIVLRASPRHCRRRIQPKQKISAAAQSAAFVCIGETCSLPVTEPDTLAETVNAVRPRPPSG